MAAPGVMPLRTIYLPLLMARVGGCCAIEWIGSDRIGLDAVPFQLNNTIRFDSTEPNRTVFLSAVSCAALIVYTHSLTQSHTTPTQ